MKISLKLFLSIHSSLSPTRQEWEEKAAEAKKEYEAAMKEYKASGGGAASTKSKKAASSPKKAVSVSPTKAGSGGGFKSKEYIDDESSEEESGSDKPPKKKSKKEAKSKKKVRIRRFLNFVFLIPRKWVTLRRYACSSRLCLLTGAVSCKLLLCNRKSVANGLLYHYYHCFDHYPFFYCQSNKPGQLVLINMSKIAGLQEY